MKKTTFLIFFLGALLLGSYAQTPWTTNGNTGITSSNFIGTSGNTDCENLVFKTRNIERMTLSPIGSFLGIGTDQHTASLHLHYQADTKSPCAVPGGPKDPLIKKLLHLTTTVTGEESQNGFYASYSSQKELLFKQQEQANFNIEGIGGGLTIAPNGKVGIANPNPQELLDVNGTLKAQNADIIGTITANALSANSVTIAGDLSTNNITAQGSFVLNRGATSCLALGNATYEYLGWGTSYIGFNAFRDNTITIDEKWIVKGDGANNGGGAIYADVQGALNFVSIPNTGVGDKNLTDTQIQQNIKMKIDAAGNVGIGKIPYQAKLDVNGSFKAQSADIAGTLSAQSANITGNISATNFTVNYTSANDWTYANKIMVNRDLTKALAIVNSTTGNEVFGVWGNGVMNVKKIFTEKIEVILTAMSHTWYDHVFYPEYQLRPLDELEQFIKENNHLPEIPSAEEVKENGLDLGDMQGKLLLKIEELTLYTIEQQKLIENLQKRLSELESKKGGE